jgi:hypothetical protein
MERNSPPLVIIKEEIIPASIPFASTDQPIPNPRTTNASNPQVHAPPYLGFTYFQHDLILELHRDNDEQRF